MAAKSNLYESQIESVARWLSCNGEVWGMGPTLVFASAAALFLFNELEETVFVPGDHVRVTTLEKTLVSTMIVGMLALMVHLWVCSMRFFQYYLDTLIKDSPGIILEMTTVGLLGGQSEIVPLGPLTRFLKQQQPQIHITVCWFLSLCYADYVRKHYCQRFNMPYLEQWQAELQQRASYVMQLTMARVNTFVGAVQTHLRGFYPPPPSSDARTVVLRSGRRRWHSEQRVRHEPRQPHQGPSLIHQVLESGHRSRYSEGQRCVRASSIQTANKATPFRNYERTLLRPDVLVVHRVKGTAHFAALELKGTLSEHCRHRNRILNLAERYL